MSGCRRGRQDQLRELRREEPAQTPQALELGYLIGDAPFQLYIPLRLGVGLELMVVWYCLIRSNDCTRARSRRGRTASG